MTFTHLEIDNEDDLQMVYETERSLQNHNVIELYVEVGNNDRYPEFECDHQEFRSQQFASQGNFEAQGLNIRTPDEPVMQSCSQGNQFQGNSNWNQLNRYSGGLDAFGSGLSVFTNTYNDEAGPSTYHNPVQARHIVEVRPMSRDQGSYPRYSVDSGVAANLYDNFARGANPSMLSIDINAVQVQGLNEEEGSEFEDSSETYDDPDYDPTNDEDDDLMPLQIVPREHHAPAIDLNLPASSSSSPYTVRFDLISTNNLNRMEVNEEQTLGIGDQSNDPIDIQKGMVFETKEQMVATVKRYLVRHHKVFRVKDSNALKWTAVCKQSEEGCPWRIRGMRKILRNKWEITKYVGEHTCLAVDLHTDHPMLDSNLLALEVESLVEADVAINVRVLIEHIRTKFGYKPSYRKTWLAKDRAIERLYGHWDESYRKLPQFFNALLSKNPGSVVQWQHFNYSPDGNSIVYTPEDTFHRVFWSFRPCIAGFQFCRPVLLIDSKFLYGKYKGSLFIASGVDGGQQILPVAFAILESENASSWNWFLSNVKEHVTGR